MKGASDSTERTWADGVQASIGEYQDSGRVGEFLVVWTKINFEIFRDIFWNFPFYVFTLLKIHLNPQFLNGMNV